MKPTCSWRVMCLWVGYGATVYHPMNSSDGKTCLSGNGALISNSSIRGYGRTLFPSHVEGLMIDFFAFFHGNFKSVDNLDFTAILSSEKSAKN